MQGICELIERTELIWSQLVHGKAINLILKYCR